MPEILQQLSIKASPAQLFAAISEQKGLANWWTADTVAKPKGGAVAEFGFNHRQVVFRMQIEELEQNQRVVWRCLGGHPEWTGTYLVFELTEEPDGKGTVVRMGHFGWRSTDGILAMCSYDWARYLTSMKSYLETGRGMPHTESP
jgi:uncharacterized protein YndB with AHSA1/START domain